MGSSYCSTPLHSSNIACLGLWQYAFHRLNFFFHLLSAAFTAAPQKKLNNQPQENQNLLEKSFIFSLVLSQDTIIFSPRASTKGWVCCLILYRKRQCCVEACCEMTGSSLSLTEAGKMSKHPPNPLRRRRISTCKMTGTALSVVFPDSAKAGSLPKTTDVQWS